VTPIEETQFRACDNRGMRMVGRRRTDGDALGDQGALARTSAALRGRKALVPRGLYRFSSFEEADAWMTTMTLSTRARRSPATSPGSARR
jgi:hypothetical protein